MRFKDLVQQHPEVKVLGTSAPFRLFCANLLRKLPVLSEKLSVEVILNTDEKKGEGFWWIHNSDTRTLTVYVSEIVVRGQAKRSTLVQCICEFIMNWHFDSWIPDNLRQL